MVILVWYGICLRLFGAMLKYAYCYSFDILIFSLSHLSNMCTMQVPPTETIPQIKKEKHSTQAKNRAKRKPPKGMFLSQEDVEAVSANATAATTVLRQLDLELVSIKRQVPCTPSWRRVPCTAAMLSLLTHFTSLRGVFCF